jgi:Protein of unknown function (DUF3570)
MLVAALGTSCRGGNCDQNSMKRFLEGIRLSLRIGLDRKRFMKLPKAITPGPPIGFQAHRAVLIWPVVRSSRSLFMAFLIRLALPTRVQAEDHVDWKHEYYEELHDRVSVETSSLLVEKSLGARLKARAQVVYDSISGATPTGGPPLPGKDQVPLAPIRDIRRAGLLELSQQLGRHTVTPKLAYSSENDYQSISMALAESFEFNNKNSTLVLGVSRDFDRLLNEKTPYVGRDKIQNKDTTDFLVGFTQLLSPTTVLTANLSLGIAQGYLTDPYKGIQFEGANLFFGPAYLFGERRPDHRNKRVAYVGLNHFVTRLNGSADLSYRFHHDSFSITAHTASLSWHQKIGKKVSLQPSLRYHSQTAADFYYAFVPSALGFPILPGPNLPQHSLHSWTIGIKVSFKVLEKLWLEAGYKRYEMLGDDSVTSTSQYPKANVFTGGLSLWF